MNNQAWFGFRLASHKRRLNALCVIRRATNPSTRKHGLPAALERALLVLAIVALVFRIAAPPGTMVANTGHGVALVLCTGHGPMAGMAMPAKAHAPRAHSDGGCEFAAHAANALTTASLELPGSSAWSASPRPQPVILSTTGAGLAAPPPPSHAPPILFS